MLKRSFVLAALMTVTLGGAPSFASTLSDLLSLVGGPIPVPEGSLFLDPVLSEDGAPVYGDGPSFDYDSATGSLGVFAPPMLGPVDDAGNRAAYIVDKVTIYHDGNTQARPDLPLAKVFVDLDLLSISNTPGSEYEPGLFTKYQGGNVGFDTRTRPGFIAVNEFVTPLVNSGQSAIVNLLDDALVLLGTQFAQGAHLHFPDLLLPGLISESQELPPATVNAFVGPQSDSHAQLVGDAVLNLQADAFSTQPANLAVADFTVEVEYIKVLNNRVFTGRTSVTLEAEPLRVPEPLSITLCLLALGFLPRGRLTRRVS